jgi:hypothetical protein
MAEMDDDELLEALGVEAAPSKASSHTALQERLIAGFEDILRFVETHGRAPQHGEDRDIFERLYAVRLDRLRDLPDARALLANLDTQGLLESTPSAAVAVDDLDDDALLSELGADATAGEDDITRLRNVASYADRKVAEEIANRTRCQDFEKFQPLFEKVRRELDAGIRRTIVLETRSLDEIQKGTFFIVSGQIAYVAEEKEEFTTSYERRDSRVRVIYDNGTESELLQRSLQRALHRDKLARLITDPDAGPLFGDSMEPEDIESGTIYVLRSQSDHPYVAQHRELIHKIGVTGTKVEARIAGAKDDATYLLADVAIVATYKLAHINRTKLENLFHKIFAPAQLDLTIEDRFGKPVKPREWFLVPLQAIDEAVSRVRDGSITKYVYDPKSARLVVAKG